jgi:hypothetical protein
MERRMNSWRWQGLDAAPALSSPQATDPRTGTDAPSDQGMCQNSVPSPYMFQIHHH